MGTDRFVSLIVGIDAKQIIKVEFEQKTRTKYDQFTGEPYEDEYQIRKTFINNEEIDDVRLHIENFGLELIDVDYQEQFIGDTICSTTETEEIDYEISLEMLRLEVMDKVQKLDPTYNPSNVKAYLIFHEL